MDIRAALAPIRCFLLDMDGTFYLGDRLLPGSLDFLDKLKATGREALFVTNNSSKSSFDYVRKLESMGVPERFRRVLTSGMATGGYILREFHDKVGFLLGNESLRCELENMGLRFSWDAPDYVLAGFDTTLDYAKMTRVCDLVRAGLPFIATHPDFNCPTDGGYIPDIGAILAFIEASTGRRPDTILGKPYTGIVSEALALTGLNKSELAMAGDRLYTDIATGVNFGMTSILVLSGEATVEDLRASDIKPTLVFDKLSDMIEYL